MLCQFQVFLLRYLKLTSKCICMSVRITLSKKVNRMQLSMKSGVSTDFYQCWPYITFFNDFHDAFRVEINTEITKKNGCITCTSQFNRSYKNV